MSQKAILASALELAQRAVHLDADNEVSEALQAYVEACRLLSSVLAQANANNDRRKLNQIYETYSDRIRLLQALHPHVERTISTKDYHDAAYPHPSSNAKSDLWPDTRSRYASPNGAEFKQHTLGFSTTRSHHRSSSENKKSPDLRHSQRQIVRERRAMTLETQNRNILPHSSTSPAGLPPTLPDKSEHLARRSSQSKGGHFDLASALQARRHRHESTQVSPSRDYDRRTLYEHGSSRQETSRTLNRRPSLNMLDYAGSRGPSAKHEPQMNNAHRRSMVSTQDGKAYSPVASQTTGSLKSLRAKMPKDVLARPYWMMRLLLGTFASSRTTDPGVYLTDHLYFPKDIWMMKNVKIKGEEEKIQAYSLVVQELQQLGHVDREDIVSLFRALEQFDKVIHAAEISLAKKMGPDMIDCHTFPRRDPASIQTGKKQGSGRVFGKFLKGAGSGGGHGHNGTTEKAGDTPSSLSGDFEGDHVVLQRTMYQLFGLAQLIEQIHLNLETESLSVKDQLRLDQTYDRAADFFSRVVIKLYLVDAAQLLHHKLAHHLQV